VRVWNEADYVPFAQQRPRGVTGERAVQFGCVAVGRREFVFTFGDFQQRKGSSTFSNFLLSFSFFNHFLCLTFIHSDSGKMQPIFCAFFSAM
jgi:hypothetical protein